VSPCRATPVEKETPEAKEMTVGEHLDELRHILIRICLVVGGFAILAFVYKENVFRIVFAPSKSDFTLYNWINRIVESMGFSGMILEDFHIQLINTELSSQFMTHISMSLYFGLLMASPYVVYQLFRFIRPALYEDELHYSTGIISIVYLLFATGLAMNYFIIFPISFRFLGTYQVDDTVVNAIALSSYISSFTLMSFMMGIVFEIPILAFILGKLGFISADMLRMYRKTAFVIIMIVSAVITPPDLFTLVLMSAPLYGLYEISILILRKIDISRKN